MTAPLVLRPYTAAAARAAAYSYDADDSTWSGATARHYAALLRDGDLTAVPASDALLSRIETDLDLTATARHVVPAVVGPFANVPAYLAGIPTAMMTFEDQEDDRGEIVIAADLFISASFKPDAYRRRGVALLALVRALAITRPVRLVAMSAMNSTAPHGCAVDLPTAPLDLAQAGFWLAHVSAFRRFAIGEFIANGGADHSTSHGFLRRPEAERHNATAAALGVDPDNLILPPSLISGTGKTPFDSDEGAAAWIQSQIDLASGKAGTVDLIEA